MSASARRTGRSRGSESSNRSRDPGSVRHYERDSLTKPAPELLEPPLTSAAPQTSDCKDETTLRINYRTSLFSGAPKGGSRVGKSSCQLGHALSLFLAAARP